VLLGETESREVEDDGRAAPLRRAAPRAARRALAPPAVARMLRSASPSFTYALPSGKNNAGARRTA